MHIDRTVEQVVLQRHYDFLVKLWAIEDTTLVQVLDEVFELPP